MLVANGDSDLVLNMRRRWQRAMREACRHDIERLTNRRVIGFMSDNHIDPDLAVEAFVLEPSPPSGADADAEEAEVGR